MSARIGIIGAGQAGARQAAGFSACSDAQIVGIADLVEGRATQLAAEYKAAPFRDWQDLFSLGLDVLVVATPHNAHVAPAEAAAARGVHSMMEKPLATNLSDARRIVEASEAAGIKLSVSFVHRYREEVRRARAWLEAVGDLQLARETMSGSRTSSHPRWLTNREAAGGGVLMYSAIHGIDRLRWFFKEELVEVSARTRRYAADNHEVEDGVAALLTFSSGAAASLDANAPVYQSGFPVWETEFHGDKAMIRIRTREFSETSSDAGMERYLTSEDPATSFALYPFQRQAADLLAAISDDRAPSVTGNDGLRALEACLAIYESAATGRPVQLNSLDV